MSDNYYNQGYQSSYPQGGYNQQQPSYQQGSQYPSQQSGGYPSQDFGPPRRQDSFGPPQHGGFQHGQAGQQYGAYDASNPQGQSQYYGGSGYDQQQYGQQQYGQQQQSYGQGHDAYQQNQQYQQQQQYGGPTEASQGVPQTAPQSSDPNAPNYDPNAPPMTESDRGLLGAALGGFGGHKFGKNQGHGFLGLIGGAIAGSMAEDALKKKKHSSHGGSYQGSQSSWGGKW